MEIKMVGPISVAMFKKILELFLDIENVEKLGIRYESGNYVILTCEDVRYINAFNESLKTVQKIILEEA